MYLNTSSLCNAGLCCWVAKSRNSSAFRRHTAAAAALEHNDLTLGASIAKKILHKLMLLFVLAIYSQTPLDVLCCQPFSFIYSYCIAPTPSLYNDIPCIEKHITTRLFLLEEMWLQYVLNISSEELEVFRFPFLLLLHLPIHSHYLPFGDMGNK